MLIKRLKSLTFALLTALGLSGPAHAAGTTPLALVPQVDSAGNVASGCLLYFYVAGTVATPQTAYQDFALTQPLPNPVTCDQSGRVPMHWLADGLIHIRLTDATGVVLVDTTMQTLGPSSGGGGGGGATIDPSTILSTGDLKVRYGTGTMSGFVRLNGLTIANGGCGASERSNADTQNLYVYLYNADPNLVVSGGRSGNALNDYNSTSPCKPLTLPDWRGKSITALADMGNTAFSGYIQQYAQCVNNGASTSPTTLGAWCGSQASVLSTSNLPPYTPSGSVATAVGGGAVYALALSGCCVQYGGTGSGASVGNLNGALSSSFSGNAQGGTSLPFSNLPPAMLATFYIKL